MFTFPSYLAWPIAATNELWGHICCSYFSPATFQRVIKIKNAHSFPKLKRANRKTEVLVLAKSVTAAFLPKSFNLPIELLQERLQRKKCMLKSIMSRSFLYPYSFPSPLNVSINKINSVQKKAFPFHKNVRHVLWLLSKQWLIISTWKRFALAPQAKAQHVSVSTSPKTMRVHHTVITRQWVCHSLLINMNKEGWIKVLGLNLPQFLTWERENSPASHSSYQNLPRQRVFGLLCVSLFLSRLDECSM